MTTNPTEAEWDAEAVRVYGLAKAFFAAQARTNVATTATYGSPEWREECRQLWRDAARAEKEYREADAELTATWGAWLTPEERAERARWQHAGLTI